MSDQSSHTPFGSISSSRSITLQRPSPECSPPGNSGAYRWTVHGIGSRTQVGVDLCQGGLRDPEPDADQGDNYLAQHLTPYRLIDEFTECEIDRDPLALQGSSRFASGRNAMPCGKALRPWSSGERPEDRRGSYEER